MTKSPVHFNSDIILSATGMSGLWRSRQCILIVIFSVSDVYVWPMTKLPVRFNSDIFQLAMCMSGRWWSRQCILIVIYFWQKCVCPADDEVTSAFWLWYFSVSNVYVQPMTKSPMHFNSDIFLTAVCMSSRWRNRQHVLIVIYFWQQCVFPAHDEVAIAF
jgi:hypothetical protein